MTPEQTLLANLGLAGVLALSALVYLRRSLAAATKRQESDANAQIARQGTEAVFDERLLKQLDERDETIRELRQQHADDMKAKNAELRESEARKRELNDRYYELLKDSMRAAAEASVAATQHNLAVMKGVSEARAEAHEANKLFREKIEAQEKRQEQTDEKLRACEESHAHCNNRLEAFERLWRSQYPSGGAPAEPTVATVTVTAPAAATVTKS